MTADSPAEPNLRLPRFVWALALFVSGLLLACGGRYGLFRDEFYYLACAEHPDWGYVDHPPLSIAVLALVRTLLGDSLLAVRLLPALALGVLILMAGRLALELGGRPFAASFAALAVAIAPQYLAVTGFYSMNAFDYLFWAGAWLLLVRLIRTDDARLWLPMGLVLGFGLLNKISPLFFGFGLAVAIVATPLRRHLARREPWLAGLLAAAIFSPYLWWQTRHGWATLEFMRNAALHKNAALAPWQFVAAQIDELHPFNAVVWLAGLAWLLWGREGRRFRALGFTFLGVLGVMLFSHAKPYYLGAAFPVLLAAGAVFLAQHIRQRSLELALLGVWGLVGALVAPVVVPILPVERLVAYQKLLGAEPQAHERHRLGPLPQHFADRFGWQELTATVAEVYRALPEAERRTALIVAGNYGEAGALNYYGKALGLPPAVSQHNNFFLWGPGRQTVDTVILVGTDADDVRSAFETVEPGPRVVAPYAMPYETARPILVCRGLRLPLAQAWARGKHFI